MLNAMLWSSQRSNTRVPLMFASRTRPCEEATIQSTSTARTGAGTAKQWVLLVTILASSMAYIDEFVVNVALPAIETDLAVSVVVI